MMLFIWSCASKVESGNKWWYRFIPKEKKCEACGKKQLFSRKL